MEERPGDSGPSESGPPNPCWWSSDFMDRFHSISISQEHALREATCGDDQDLLSPQSASQVFWSTGVFSGPIPNGFYSVVPDERLKEHFKTIPSPDELYSLDTGGVKADIILVDAEKDKKLSMLKQLTIALVKGLNSNPASLIKKIAGLVIDFYKRPNPELSPAKAAHEDISHLSENRGVQLLGQIRHGSCRPRAMLFKVLADAVGLESKLVVQERVTQQKMTLAILPSSQTVLSVRFQTELMEKDFMVSGPFTSNLEHDDNLQYLYQRRNEASSMAGSSLRNVMLRPTSFVEGKLSSSHSEPNIANAFWRRSRRKAVVEQRTASSSKTDASEKANKCKFKEKSKKMAGKSFTSKMDN
ncbi:hypothetical protein QJS04_geneDACA000833 [Acorus gramineus]|uniref:EDR1/CTR1/ARMC3-like peptidase-like domain-containing protein n=1 Tax=Acorus gramineus TaxID=55184 RepID=A0AAV9BES7_ACOGR|nr:hypothetical protein QJS04_geneDACA000833 [Acorus gramineus]